GPVSTYMARYYIHRQIAFFGVSFVFLAILFCSLSQHLLWLYLCYGVLGGIGMAFASPHGFLLTQKYFHKQIKTANSLSVISGPLGLMVVPPFLYYLMSELTIDGGFLLWGGIMLHAFVCVSLFHPTEWHLKSCGSKRLPCETLEAQALCPVRPPICNATVSLKPTEASIPVSNCNKLFIESSQMFSDKEEVRDKVQNGDIKTPEDFMSEEEDEEEEENEETKYWDTRNDLSPYMFVGKCKSFSCGNLVTDDVNFRQWKNPLTDGNRINEFKERPRTISVDRSMEILPQILEEPEEEIETFEMEIESEKLEFLTKDSEKKSTPISISNGDYFNNSNSVDDFSRWYTCVDLLDQFGSALSIPNDLKMYQINRTPYNDDNCYISTSSTRSDRNIAVRPKALLGLKLPKLTDFIKLGALANPIFLITAISSIINHQVYLNFITFLPTLGVQLGLGPSTAVLLLTTVAAAELAAKVFMMAIIDKTRMQSRFICIMAGISNAAAIFCLKATCNIVSLLFVCVWYGLSMGLCMSVGPLLAVEYVGVRLLPHTYGLTLMMNAAASVLTFPLFGVVNDVSSNLLVSYYLLGGLSLVSPLLWTTVPLLSRNQVQKTQSPPKENV
ncbi:unnamed protein product, partial [Meganyctiphanes norvegica]